MKSILLVAILLLAANVCIGQTQYEMNIATGKEYQKADKELNRIYQKIISNNKTDTLFIKNLKKAQRAWIIFRDAQMAMKYPDNGEPQGTSSPMCKNIYYTELTNDRIKQLEVWLTGIEEGDICIGSVPFKK